MISACVPPSATWDRLPSVRFVEGEKLAADGLDLMPLITSYLKAVVTTWRAQIIVIVHVSFVVFYKYNHSRLIDALQSSAMLLLPADAADRSRILPPDR